jgi:hypothetical protein
VDQDLRTIPVRLLVPEQDSRVATPDNAPIRPPRASLDRIDWSQRHGVPNPYNASDKGIADLPAHKEPEGAPVLLGYSKLESTVLYLGIEVDDAHEMAEQTEV